jgi:DNA primase
MSDDKEILLDILCKILGDPEKVYDSKLQYGYNCPECGVDERKGNLEVSLEKHLFHCWACGDVNNMQGPLGKLLDLYGTKQQKKIYNLLQPENHKPKEKRVDKLKLPEGFTLFKDSTPIYPIRRQAHNYLISRGITDEMIEKYSVGFCDKGSHKGRIVVPSYDLKGELNYYIARSWDPKSRAKYKNPEAEKDKIIFNEHLINWGEDIFLVEGVFDGFFLPNSIPMLGKHMSSLLFDSLYKKAKGLITIALDGDAFKDSIKLYNELNGGDLYGRVKLVKLTEDKDVCDLKGQIDEYYYKMKY